MPRWRPCCGKFWHPQSSEFLILMFSCLYAVGECSLTDIVWLYLPTHIPHNSPKPSSVHIMTHIIREGPKDGEPSKGPAGPLYGVHVDQSVWAARGVAQRWLGDAAEELLAKPRYQIINVSQNTTCPFLESTHNPFTDRPIVSSCSCGGQSSQSRVTPSLSQMR